MKINFFIPFISKSGGIITTIEYSQKLKQKGHDVILYYPVIPHWSLFDEKQPLLLRFAILLKRFLLKSSIDWYFEKIPVKPVLKFTNRFIRDADISVATAWPTAYDVYNLDPVKGKKFYFVQGHETWINNKAIVEDSYRLPLKIITISPWLTEIMEEKYSRKVECEIYNGIRTDKFYPPVIKNECPVTISMQYHCLVCKGAHEGLAALAKIKSEFPDVRIILFGLFTPPEKTFEFEYFRNPDHGTLLTVYQQSHIYLFPSHGEGWGMTPLEAMACKCAVVGTDVGSINVIGTVNNVEKIEAGNVNSIYNALKKLIMDKERRISIAECGYKTIQKYTWEKECKKMEKVFLKNIVK